MNMGTFGGQPVNGDLVLACMQLGTGNCQKAINSGSCSGFADSNGTTICSMADKIANGTSSGGSGSGGGGSSSNGSSGGGEAINTTDCIRDASGNCEPIAQAMSDGFQSGAGFGMSEMKSGIYAIIAAGIMLLSISIIKDCWKLYSSGRIELYLLLSVVLRVAISIMFVLTILSFT
jgi:hypothetical protein